LIVAPEIGPKRSAKSLQQAKTRRENGHVEFDDPVRQHFVSWENLA